jgi:hypothetical protein
MIFFAILFVMVAAAFGWFFGFGAVMVFHLVRGVFRMLRAVFRALVKPKPFRDHETPPDPAENLKRRRPPVRRRTDFVNGNRLILK